MTTTTVRDGDVLRMRELPAVELKPGETVAFAPGALHVMLLDVIPSGTRMLSSMNRSNDLPVISTTTDCR